MKNSLKLDREEVKLLQDFELPSSLSVISPHPGPLPAGEGEERQRHWLLD